MAYFDQRFNRQPIPPTHEEDDNENDNASIVNDASDAGNREVESTGDAEVASEASGSQETTDEVTANATAYIERKPMLQQLQMNASDVSAIHDLIHEENPIETVDLDTEANAQGNIELIARASSSNDGENEANEEGNDGNDNVSISYCR